LLDAARPLLDVVLTPVVPLLGRRVGLEVGAGREAIDGHSVVFVPDSLQSKIDTAAIGETRPGSRTWRGVRGGGGSSSIGDLLGRQHVEMVPEEKTSEREAGGEGGGGGPGPEER